MASKETPQAIQPADFVLDLIEKLNARGTSSVAYLQGEHAQHTWGIKIPSLAFQWLIGGSSIFPAQRYIGISGLPKSFKSTLGVEIGNWFIAQNGMHILLDTEHKTSDGMMDALTWASGLSDRRTRIFQAVESIEAWQSNIVDLVDYSRKKAPREKGKRIPVLATVDSLSGRTSEDAMLALRKNGHAEGRQFPVGAASITNFLEALSLLGTTMSISWVQHLKTAIDSGFRGFGPPEQHEKGASAASFSGSVHLRVAKGSSFQLASQEAMPSPDTSVEGHTMYIQSVRSCLGPDSRKIEVDLMWQYIVQEDGSTRQAMVYDWDGALGNMLCQMKYNDKWFPKLFKQDRDRLSDTLMFTESRKNCITCKALDLEGASYTKFGRAIKENEKARTDISRFLGIKQYIDIQESDIDFGDKE